MSRHMALGNPLIFQGDTSNHGGVVLTGYDGWVTTAANGSKIPMAMVTDMFSRAYRQQRRWA